jgi:hypothetical protein
VCGCRRECRVSKLTVYETVKPTALFSVTNRFRVSFVVVIFMAPSVLPNDRSQMASGGIVAVFFFACVRSAVDVGGGKGMRAPAS